MNKAASSIFDLHSWMTKTDALKHLKAVIDELDYTVVDKDETKPWGAYYRFANSEADRFIKEFFPRLSIHDAKLGHDEVELSPKFLLVLPGQRLSWQFHDRRTERWRYLTKGAYFKSLTDEQGAQVVMEPGEVVQFEQGERHRLCSLTDSYTLVAEIWQHTDPLYASDESDIVRLEDDYNR